MIKISFLTAKYYFLPHSISGSKVSTPIIYKNPPCGTEGQKDKRPEGCKPLPEVVIFAIGIQGTLPWKMKKLKKLAK